MDTAPLPWRAACLVTIMLGPTPGTNGTQAPAAVAPAARGVPAWGDDGFTFGDLIDVVNPLQHIPVVSWAYRALTGDNIAPAAKVVGGTLFGGPVGLALSAIDAALLHRTGRDSGETVVALLSGKDRGAPAPTNAAPDGIAIAARTAPAGTTDATPTLTEAQMARLLGGAPVAAPAPAATPACNRQRRRCRKIRSRCCCARLVCRRGNSLQRQLSRRLQRRRCMSLLPERCACRRRSRCHPCLFNQSLLQS